MTGEKNNALAGPLAQSIDIGFRAARFAIASLALGWATMNVREVPPDMRVVVTRLGAVDRVQQAGLVVAWPRPFERVLLMPGSAQQMTQHIEADASATLGLDETVSKSEAPKSAHGYLTGDGASC
jgi:regulator of protease activity HflC (stomatin/prohibitin superfamily)